MDAMGGVRIVGTVKEIFQPAEMIEVRHIEQVIPHNVQVEQGPPFAIGDPRTHPSIE